ncbi:hypothetical protein C8R45DRAFT_838731 [Mycena sanguinolenta]|nr:hypothetical protein C8R45DRAFT_838731 [Mycena sanguinolenta]
MASFSAATLPIEQLESLRFKANQIIENIQSLHWTIEAGHMPYMPAWPDILSKYNMLLSQTHNFSTALAAPAAVQLSLSANGVPTLARPQGNPYEGLALHPSKAMTDAQLDTEAIPLLRNQQTTDVLRMENDTVRRLASHMTTRGSLGVLGAALPTSSLGIAPPKPEYDDVIVECETIRAAHDQRVERAVRAVAMLRDKFELRQRVQVEVEEPEELSWDPRLGMPPEAGTNGADESEGSSGDDDDEDIVEGELVDSNMATDSPVFAPPSSNAAPQSTMIDVNMF